MELLDLAVPLIPHVIYLRVLSRKKWSRGYFNVFPLPLFSEVDGQDGFEIEDRGWGVLLELAAPIETSQLDVARRVVCLAPK